ncbi:MAG: phosphotransferase [Candidatus Binatia bacterium]|nr:phosphotransferase [Candidatus Binatia bacterium]
MKVFSGAAVSHFAASYWDVPPYCECQFVRRGFNDHYRLGAGKQVWYARFYLPGKWWIRGHDDCLAELEILHDLSKRGLPVGAPIRTREERWAVTLPGEETLVALFPAVAGAPLEANAVGEWIQEIGRNLGKLHLAMTALGNRHPRMVLETRDLVDDPMDFLASAIRRRRGIEIDFFRGVIEELKDSLKNLARTQERFGLCHGDANLRNVLCSRERGAYMIDFDHAFVGWRGLDIANFLLNLATEHHRNFLDAYESVRPMDAEERSLLPVFADLMVIRGARDVQSMFPVWGLDPDGEVFDLRIDFILDWMQKRLQGISLLPPLAEPT